VGQRTASHAYNYFNNGHIIPNIDGAIKSLYPEQNLYVLIYYNLARLWQSIRYCWVRTSTDSNVI